MLQALALKATDDTDAAVMHLHEAVALGEHELYFRVFTNDGPALVPLLRALSKVPGAPRHARRLLAALSRRNTTAASRPRPGIDDLIEPLSDRELEVLRLLDTSLTGPAIARELVVSLNTVRSHTKSIFAKFGVKNRQEALARGRDLGLLSGANSG